MIKTNDLVCGKAYGHVGYFLVHSEGGVVDEVTSLDDNVIQRRGSVFDIKHVLDNVFDSKAWEENDNDLTVYINQFTIEDLYYIMSAFYRMNGRVPFLEETNYGYKWKFIFNTPVPGIYFYVKEQGDFMVAGIKSSDEKLDKELVAKWFKQLIEYMINNVRDMNGNVIGDIIIVLSGLDADTNERIKNIKDKIKHINSSSVYGYGVGYKNNTTTVSFTGTNKFKTSSTSGTSNIYGTKWGKK